MHKFIDNIVAFSLKNKFFIFFCTTVAVIAGLCHSSIPLSMRSRT